MPTPKPDAAALSTERLAELRECALEDTKLPESYPVTKRAAATVLALLAEREEARRILSDLVDTAERFDTDAMHSVAARARAHLSGKRSTEEGGAG